jgi:hypothetical protein
VNKAHNAELKLFLEVELGLVIASFMILGAEDVWLPAATPPLG